MNRPPTPYRWIVELCPRISVFQMNQAGIFRFAPGYTWRYSWRNMFGEIRSSIGYKIEQTPDGGLELLLMYQVTDPYGTEKIPVDERIRISQTPCNFGGIRYWYHCPLIRGNDICDRRVGVLYLPPSQKYFGCRHCHNLTYRSQKEHNKAYDLYRKHPEKLVERTDSKGYWYALRLLTDPGNYGGI